MNFDPELSRQLEDWNKKLMLVTGVSSLLSALGFLLNPDQFMVSYLIAFLFWMGLTVGSLPMIGLHHLTSGHWGFPVRRILETSASMIPLVAVLFLPVLLKASSLYLWARPEIVSHDPLLQAKAAYLNLPFFALRAAVYFGIWFVLGYQLHKNSREYDRTPSEETLNRLQVLGGLTLVLYGLTVSFAAIDWAMSIEPHWYSTIYGIFFMVGQTLSAFAFALLVCLGLSHRKPFSEIVNSERSHDLGNLLFAMIMLWAYISISQFVIIWSGNLPEETPWYLRRIEGGWLELAVILVLFHFLTPFFLLLMRRIKKNPSLLSKVALFLIVIRWIDLYWFIKPAFETRLHFHWLDFTLFGALGGLWLLLFIRLSKKTDFKLAHDPFPHGTLSGHP